MKFGAEPARKAHKNLSEAGAAVSINYLESLCSAPTCWRFRVDRAWMDRTQTRTSRRTPRSVRL